MPLYRSFLAKKKKCTARLLAFLIGATDGKVDNTRMDLIFKKQDRRKRSEKEELRFQLLAFATGASLFFF